MVWKRTLLLSLAAALLMSARNGQAAEYVFAVPSDDRWHYPYNFSVGGRTIATCFGTAGTPTFNDRDGIMIIAWQTGNEIAPGLAADAYGIRSVTVTLTNTADAAWPVDLTVDEWFTYDVDGNDILNLDGVPRGEPGDVDGESDDEDPGRPIELFGAGFGPFYTAQSWNELSLFIGSANSPGVARDPFPFVFQDVTGALLHVEDNVKGLHNDHLPVPVYGFTPTPWAIGVPIDYTPGNQPVPFDVVFQVDLTLSEGAVRRYFQEQLSAGRVFVAVTSLTETIQEGPQGGVPAFYTKEAVGIPGAKAPRLDLSACLAVRPDLDMDCDVDSADLERFEQCVTGPAKGSVEEGCARADFDGDGDVDQEDFGILQRCLSGDGIEPDPACAS